MNTLVLLRALLVAGLILLNAFFVAAEFALVSVRDTRIQQLIEAGRIGARTVQKLHRNIDGVLNAVQFGITIASLGLGWAGEPFVARLLEGVVGSVPYVRVYSTTISFVVAFLLITYLLPQTLIFIPLYQTLSDLGLVNTYGALMLTYPTFLLPFATWVLMGYFRSIPVVVSEGGTPVLLRDVARGNTLGDVTTLANADVVSAISTMAKSSTTEASLRKSGKCAPKSAGSPAGAFSTYTGRPARRGASACGGVSVP